MNKTILKTNPFIFFVLTFLFSSFGFSQDVNDCSSFQVATVRGGQTTFSSDFEAAVDAAQGGDEIRIGDGTFPRVRVRDKSNIVIKSTCASIVQSFIVRRSDTVRIEGFEVTDTNGDKSGIYLGSNANANNNIQIVGNKIHGMTPNGGVRVRIGNTNILIENNEMFGNQNAIIVNGASNVTIKNNIIRDNLKNGIKITNMSGNVVIEDNDIFGNANNGIVTLDHDPSGSVSIKNNQIHENTLDGINIGRGSVAVSIESNDIFGNANGVDVTRNTGDGPIDLTNNTIRDNNKNGVHIKGDSIVNLTSNLIENNGLGGDDNNGYGIKKRRDGDNERVTLTDNTIINNNGRVVDGQRSRDLHDFTKILDSTDSGNMTTGGDEGPGVVSNDGEPPVISSNLTSGQTITTVPFVLDVIVTDQALSESLVFLNGVQVTGSTEASFSVSLSLNQGNNTVKITSVDRFNNSSEVEYTNIFVDSVGPALTINFTDGQHVFLDPSRLIDFVISTSEPAESVTINGVEAFGFNQDFSLTLAASALSPETFTIVAEDTLGNITQDTINLSYVVDTDRPIITLTQTDDVFTSQENFSLNISINDIAGTTTRVFVNGTQALESPDKTISTSVPLNLGRNEIRITSIDSAGNVAVPVVLDNVNFNNQPINLSIGSPGLGDELTDSIANISGASDKELSSITVNGSVLQLSENKINFSGSFDFGNATGELLLNFVATDLYGNTANLSHPVFIREVVRKNLAYFTDSSSGKLLVYDSDDFSFVREVQVNEPDQDDLTNGRVANLALSVDKKRAFVVGTTKESAFVVDLEQDAVSASQVINLKQDPNVTENTSLIHNKPIQVAESGIHTYFISAFLPELLFDGQTVPEPAVPAKLFIYDNQANTFSSFELPGLDPESMVVDSSGSKIYMSTSSNSVAVVDTASNSILETISIPVSALKSNDLVLSNDESDIFVSSSESNLLYRIDLTSKQLEQSIDLGGLQEGLVRLGSGNKIYALVNKNGSSVISTVDESTNTVSVEIDLGFQATKMKANLDLSQIWVTSESSSQVKIYDIATNAVIHTFAVNSPLDVDFGYIDDKSTANIPPLASFTFSPSESVAPAVYSFDASSSRDLDGNIASYQWVIEGQSYSGQSVTHRFEQPGTFTAALTVTDDSSESRTRTIGVVVGDQNALPIANFYSQAETDFGLLKVQFDASSSFKTGGEISEYRWDFGNGKTGTGADVTHQYEAIGTYLVTLTVVDNFGVSASSTKSVSPTDVTPLGLSILSPRPGHLTNSSSVTIVGSTDEDSPMIKVAGERVLPAADKSFTKDIGLSTQGLNIITVEAQDDAGNNNRLNLPIIYDSVAPILSNLTPANGTTLYQKDGNVLVSVEASEPISSLSVNGVSLTVQNNAQRVFTGVVPFISSGTSGLSVSATDLAGNTNTLTDNFELVIDADAPVITFNEEPQALTNQASFNLSINVIDATPVTTVIEFNGSVVANNSQISFVSGSNSIKVTSTDSAGNAGLVERTVLFDNVAPDSQLSLNDGFLTNQSSISIQARVFDVGTTSSGIFLNGTLVQSSAESIFDAQLSLQEGSNTVVLTSGDEAGNLATQKEITIVLDTTPPVISNIRPETGTVVGLRTLDLFISAESNEPLSSLTIDGQEMGLNIGDIIFQDRIQLFGDGQATLNLLAIDKAGNQTQITHQVETVYDSVDPVIFVSGIAEDQSFSSSNVPVNISVTDSSSVSTKVFLNDQFVFDSTENNFIYTLNLSEGVNALKVISEDSVGRSSEVVISNLNLDTRSPVLSIASPTDGQTFEDSNVLVSFNSNEPLSRVMIEGIEFSPNGATTFQETINFMETGALTVSIRAYDLLDNEFSITVPINIIEAAPPQPGQVIVESERNAACAVVSGKLYCWGENTDGQVGNGTTVNQPLPVLIPGMESGVTKVDPVRSVNCATKNNQLFCWGRSGNIGVLIDDPTQTPRFQPVTTPRIMPNFESDINDFSLASGNICALKADAVYCMGDNTGATIDLVPKLIPGLESDVVAISHGGTTVCALTDDQKVKCQGKNNLGQVGIGTVSEEVEIASEVLGISESVVQFDTNAVNACAVTTGGKLYCWGSNRDGQLGDGTTIDRSVATEIFSSGIKSVSVSFSGKTTCAVTTDGAAKCWGRNDRGNMGLGFISSATFPTPTDVVGLSSGVESINAGEALSCAAMTNGEVKCWGEVRNNPSFPAYLGDGTSLLGSTIPVTVNALPLPDSPQAPVVANIAANAIRGKVPLDMNLSGAGSFSRDGTIVSYSWKVNGVEVSTSQDYSQLITTPGQQEVMLTVTDDQGQSADNSIIVIAEDDSEPVALFAHTLNISNGVNTVLFDASDSFDKDNAITTYNWSFGDSNTGTGVTTSHQYTSEGTYTVALTVTSDSGQQQSYSKEITVKDVVPPILTITSPQALSKVQRNILITGSSNEQLQSLKLNGNNISINADNISFSSAFSMNKEGVQTLKLEATDLAGNVSRKDLIVDFDTTGPILSDFSPSEGSDIYTQNGFLQVIAKSNEKLSSATVNGVSTLLIGDDDEILGTLSINGDELASIEIVATDEVGNTTSKTIRIKHEIDTSLPTLSATGSQAGFTQDSNFAIDVNASDNSPLRVEIYKDGLKIHESAQNTFTFNTTLEQGANNFEVRAIDAAANTTVVALDVVTLDNLAPQVLLSSPSENDVLENHKFTVIGSVSEPLSSLVIGGQSVAVASDLSFEQEIEAPSTGPFNLDIIGTDRAGNTVHYSQPLTFDLLLNPKLISINEIDGSDKLLVVGQEGATRANSSVSVSASFFNSQSTTSNGLGQFSFELDPFNFATISVINGASQGSATLNYAFKTRLAGTIKSINGNSLPGVTIRISGSDSVAITDVSGTFSFDNPSSGDQKLIVDASALNTDNIKYSNTEIAVNVSFNRDNILEKPVYLAPTIIDGSETLLTENGGTSITNSTVPGVEVSIPSGIKAFFPDGGSSGIVSLAKTPSEFAVVPVPEFAVPEEIIHLEPSGLRFNAPVELTLPNDNELPAGVELVVMSMDANKGTWEVDGFAKVDPSGSFVKTKAGQGITHFSPKYVVPIAPVIRQYASVGQRGINTLEGGLESKINLPNHKSLGNLVTPRLIYNSAWAKPTAIVTNYFDIPEQRAEFSNVIAVTANERFLRSPDVKVNQCLSTDDNQACFEDYFDYWLHRSDVKQLVGVSQTAWYEPENIKTQFFVSGLTTKEFGTDFDQIDEDQINFSEGTRTGNPNQSLISFGVDLKKNNGDYFDSGLYPSVAHYDIQLKRILLTSRLVPGVEIPENRPDGIPTFGTVVAKRTDSVDSKVIDDLFPVDITSPVYVQNQVDSAFGRGWRFGGLKRIANPNSNRILLEEDDGSLSLYNADIGIETLLDLDGQEVNLERGVSFHSWPNIAVVKEVGGVSIEPLKADLSSANPTLTAAALNFPQTGGNFRTAQVCPVGQRLKSPSHKFIEWRHDFTIPRKVQSMIMLPDNRIFGTDENAHSFFLRDNLNYTNLIQDVKGLPTPAVLGVNNVASVNSYCMGNFNTPCSSRVKIDEVTCPSFPQISNFDLYHKYVGHGRTGDFVDGAANVVNVGQFPTASTEGLNSPMGLAIGIDGFIYLADKGNNRILRANPQSGAYTIVAGNGSGVDSGDGGPALNAGIYHPRGIAFDTSGNMFITTERGLIRKVDTSGNISTYAGVPLGSEGSLLEDRVDKSQLALGLPTGIVVNSAAQLMYIADTQLNRVIQIDMVSEQADLIAGSGEACSPSNIGDGGSALNACLSRPTWLGFDDNFNVLIADAGNNRIRRVNFSGASSLASFVPASRDNSRLNKLGDGTYERVRRNGTIDKFDTDGLITSIVDRVGRTTSFFYNQDKNIEKIIDPVNQEITFSYSGNNVTSISSPGGITTFSYIGKDLSRVDFPDGTNRQFVHDNEGLIVEEINQRSISTTYGYSPQNRLSKITYADGAEVVIDDHLDGTFVDSSLPSTDLMSLDSGEITGGLSSNNEEKVTFSKDLNGYIHTIKDALGNETITTKNLLGQTTSIKRPDGSIVNLEYNPETLDLIRETDTASGEVREREVNEYGQVTRQRVNGKEVVRVFSGITGLLESETLPSGNTRSLTYNPLGLVNSSTRQLNGADQITTSYMYDSVGNTTTASDSLGKVEILSYDSAGNVTRKQTKRADSDFITVDYTYDGMGRVKTITDSKNEVTEYFYSPTGKIEKVTDPINGERVYSYDLRDRASVITNPLGGQISYSYDADGNLIQEINERNQVINYTYNDYGQVIKKETPDDTIDYFYNVNQILERATNKNSRIDFTIDSIDRITAVTVRGVGDLSDYPQLTINYGYNEDSKLSSYSDNHGTSVGYSYNNEGNLNTITDTQGFVYQYTYDILGRVTQLSMPGMDTNYEYDGDLGVTRIEYVSGGNVQSFIDYTRNNLSHITSVTSPRETASIGYDENNWVSNVSRTYSNTNGPTGFSNYNNESFQYDEVGNRVSDSFGSYVYDALKQRLNENAFYFFSYDPSGNLIGKTDKSTGEFTKYEYSSTNQLLKVTVFPDQVTSTVLREVEYFYDALGRRMKKVAKDNQNLLDKRKTFTRQYGYNFTEMYLEFDENGNLLTRYLNSSQRTDDTLSVEYTPSAVTAEMTDSASTYIFLKDQLGSINHIADTNGQIVQNMDYSAYGKLVRVTDSTDADVTASPTYWTAYAYTNRELDIETGLYQYRARVYDSDTGRFLQQDPDPGRIGSPITQTNKHTYAGNNPYNYIDPSGEAFFTALLIGALLSGLIAGSLAVIATGDFSAFLPAFGKGFVTTFVVGMFGAVGGAIAAIAGWGSSGAFLLGGLFGGLAGGALGAGFNPDNATAGFLLGFMGGFIGGGISGLNAARDLWQPINRIRLSNYHRMVEPEIQLPKNFNIPASNIDNIPLTAPAFDPGNGVPIGQPL